MAEFKVIAGDFGQGVKGNVRVGKMYRVSAQGFTMPVPGSPYKTQHIPTGQIDTLEVATEESLKKMSGSIGWGFLGGLALGPIGALAGVLAGGRKTELTFICQFKDGRKFLGQCYMKTYTAIQAATFVAQPKAKVSPPSVVSFAIITVVFMGVAIWLAHGGPSKPATSRADTLNQPALKLVTYLLADDMSGMLARDQSSPVWPKVEDLLTWLHLAWRIPAANYETEYDANEIAADNKFKGQRILVIGSVSSVSKDFTDESYVLLRGSGLVGVRAQLNEMGAHSAASFKKGQQVALVCMGSGQAMTIATLDNCESLNDYINALSPPLQDRVGDFLEGGKPLGDAAALPIVTMYVVGLHLPHDSPCLNGKRTSCVAEIKALRADKNQSQALQTEAKTMLGSLKVN
jgi:hypothetical protein